MVKVLKRLFIGPIIASLIFINMLFWMIPITFLALLKLFPHKSNIIDSILDSVYQLTVGINGNILKNILGIHFIIQGDLRLTYSNNYIVLSNHLSWSDAFIAQIVLNRRIPPLKFLSKRQVIFIPFVGIISWAFNFPLLGRSEKNKDQNRIIKNLTKIKSDALSFLIFPEGTRFTKEKNIYQKSPFKYLLKPKIGGFSTLINAKIEYENVVDLTLLYPDQKINFWDFLSGNISHVYIYVRKLPLSEKTGGYQVKEWIFQKWKEKDNLLKSFRD